MNLPIRRDVHRGLLGRRRRVQHAGVGPDRHRRGLVRPAGVGRGGALRLRFSVDASSVLETLTVDNVLVEAGDGEEPPPFCALGVVQYKNW
ncbi:hypothetical protein Vau01_041800 [Virgisporangium aurantiacum]|uniref:Uncharacterized protein n=1 Tax=Virgisporangium aurantiacum TaxID=175570 RepID=A0A8J4E066_9ACTN|nr:hypothetical protein Vau01_041800 [Virgisporangium aurantiacum]